MKIGFTGSSTKITVVQEISLKELLNKFRSKYGWSNLEGHHGDCIMGDEIFHETCYALRIPVVIHPPLNEKKRANCQGFTEIWGPKEYLERNKDIVNQASVLIAMPDSYEEKLRSGTWSTVRYAIKQMKQIYIIFPDGSIEVR